MNSINDFVHYYEFLEQTVFKCRTIYDLFHQKILTQHT